MQACKSHLSHFVQTSCKPVLLPFTGISSANNRSIGHQDHQQHVRPASFGSGCRVSNLVATSEKITCNVVCCAAAAPDVAGPSLGAHNAKAGDVLKCSAFKDGSQEMEDVYLEVLKPWDENTSSCVVQHQGRLLTVSQDAANQPHLLVSYSGPYITASSALMSSYPGWSQCLGKLLPRLQQPPVWNRLQAGLCQVVASLSQLEQKVASNPGPWRDGTAPGEPLPQGLDVELSSAGELLSLMSGARGIVMVQLYVGWDATIPQPALRPFMITLLARAAANKDLSITMSSIKDGMGLTALVSAKKEPFKSWAKNMASFGAQSSLVAGSPFYQLLIGRMLGYKEEYIHAYIQEKAAPGTRPLTPQIIAAVDAELMKISAKKPNLPWNAGSRGKKK